MLINIHGITFIKNLMTVLRKAFLSRKVVKVKFCLDCLCQIFESNAIKLSQIKSYITFLTMLMHILLLDKRILPCLLVNQ